ncbi:polysaccharide deacetylase family protein [Sporosarcina sp. YIM B06819]|uniref:polysaccharide deacetylase family protein n=1 Tax=Sporosarcina sp. YIM B06819 TaxID=3081769 RepID=UPI00298C57BF|nr:polysaccharide deacetylase family protein [Sporosarcina sp. YIM B06819]
MSKKGIFIVSLDFELNWGVHDVFTLGHYQENIVGVRQAIPRMLELFNHFDIHATWATVGMLFFDNKKELLANLPELHPSYADAAFSPYDKLASLVGENEQQDPLHFGASLIKEIMDYPNQELATHTFSHYYCLETGQTAAQFEADVQASVKVAKAIDQSTKSMIFPRNQINHDYLQICKVNGIQCFRGHEDSWVYQVGPFHNKGIIKRMLRLADCYLPIFGDHTYSIDQVTTEPIVNLPSSRFLRPYHTSLKSLEPLRLRRIKKSITNAAKKGEIFHLWWHPHNFGKDIESNLGFLTEILIHVATMREQYGLTSLTMAEASTLALQGMDSHTIRSR